MTVGYMFWHAPAAGSQRAGYEHAMTAWQEALAAHPPPGFAGGWTWRLPAPPWLAGWPASVYLDVYVVADFAALGLLNTAAPSGPLQAAHDDAARRAGFGAGALFAIRSGRPRPHPGEAHLHWYDKPPGASYPDTLGALAGAGRAVWLRQMVLGAGPELLVVEEPARASAPRARSARPGSGSARLGLGLGLARRRSAVGGVERPGRPAPGAGVGVTLPFRSTGVASQHMPPSPPRLCWRPALRCATWDGADPSRGDLALIRPSQNGLSPQYSDPFTGRAAPTTARAVWAYRQCRAVPVCSFRGT